MSIIGTLVTFMFGVGVGYLWGKFTGYKEGFQDELGVAVEVFNKKIDEHDALQCVQPTCKRRKTPNQYIRDRIKRIALNFLKAPFDTVHKKAHVDYAGKVKPFIQEEPISPPPMAFPIDITGGGGAIQIGNTCDDDCDGKGHCDGSPVIREAFHCSVTNKDEGGTDEEDK
jgi:hypothetical protein